MREERGSETAVKPASFDEANSLAEVKQGLVRTNKVKDWTTSSRAARPTRSATPTVEGHTPADRRTRDFVASWPISDMDMPNFMGRPLLIGVKTRDDWTSHSLCGDTLRALEEAGGEV